MDRPTHQEWPSFIMVFHNNTTSECASAKIAIVITCGADPSSRAVMLWIISIVSYVPYLPEVAISHDHGTFLVLERFSAT